MTIDLVEDMSHEAPTENERSDPAGDAAEPDLAFLLAAEAEAADREQRRRRPAGGRVTPEPLVDQIRSGRTRGPVVDADVGDALGREQRRR